jgi:toxin ParE1/3/4
VQALPPTLATCFHKIAENPNRGRNCDYLAPGLMRIEEGKHMVFFTEKPYGVRIVRVLHERMMPGRHDLTRGEEDDE